MKYRITFYDGPQGNLSVHKDVDANNSDHAFQIAYNMSEASDPRYTDVMVEEVPTEASPIGLEVEYEDTYFKRQFTGYVIIKANNEKEACDYYNRNYKGKRFWFNCGTIEEEGKCIYGRIKSTYFASCLGFDADATA